MPISYNHRNQNHTTFITNLIKSFRMIAIMKNRKSVFSKKAFCYIGVTVLLIAINTIFCLLTHKSKSVLIVALSFPCIIALFYAFAWSFSKNEKVLRFRKMIFFCGTFFLLGAFYLIIFPPFTVPDELYHYVASYMYSDIFLGYPDISYESIPIREADRVLLQEGMGRLFISDSTYSFMLSNCSLFGDSAMSSISGQDLDADGGPFILPNLTDNPLQLKIASVLGITLGRIIGLGAIPTYYLGEMMSLVLVMVLISIAVWIAPIGKRIIAISSLLPMSLHLFSSYSYDATIIALSFLLIGLFFKAIYGKGLLNRKLLISIGVVIALLAPCKLIYSLIALCVFLIPQNRFSSKKRSYIIKIGMIFIACISIFVFRLDTILSYLGLTSSEEILRTRGGDESLYYSMSDVFANPFGIIVLFARTIQINMDFYLTTLVGGSLGWFDAKISGPSWLVILLFIILLFSTFSCKGDNNQNIKGSQRAMYITIFILVILATICSMLFMQAFKTELAIVGVQGRYLLPVLPLLLLALRTNLLQFAKNPELPLICAMGFINAFYLANIFAKAMAA